MTEQKVFLKKTANATFIQLFFEFKYIFNSEYLVDFMKLLILLLMYHGKKGEN